MENSSRIAVNVFSDIDSAESYYRQNHDKVLAGVIFHNELFDNYTIRTKFWDTPSPLQLRNSNGKKYLYSNRTQAIDLYMWQRLLFGCHFDIAA